MARFKKKPVVAIQWIGTNVQEITTWFGRFGRWNGCVLLPSDKKCAHVVACFDFTEGKTVLKILTLEGEMVANQGDWIIRGVKGEFYPCKPDIFEATYEQEPEDCYGG